MLHLTADHGTLGNEEKFRKLNDGIWEFKSFQVRLLCCFEESPDHIDTSLHEKEGSHAKE